MPKNTPRCHLSPSLRWNADKAASPIHMYHNNVEHHEGHVVNVFGVPVSISSSNHKICLVYGPLLLCFKMLLHAPMYTGQYQTGGRASPISLCL